ncbi:m09 protein [Murid betaherpesvirus 1]|uniref:M09 protein n=1 Tax=Murid herpesvirus 1 TaxID=10366 RepID=H2A1M6_MUHV1|nr:m09 protein [Murid betaherpesvirus 1]CCE57338.1 m09 protein [Murid betaherpesvirus 1]
MKLFFSSRLLLHFLIFAVIAAKSLITSAATCDAVRDRAFFGANTPGQCRTISVTLKDVYGLGTSSIWVYTCELPTFCINATWRIEWVLDKNPINVSVLYESTTSTPPKFKKLIKNNATTRPPPTGFEINPNNGYLYIYPIAGSNFYISCTGFVCVPPKPITTTPSTTRSRSSTETRTIRNGTKFITHKITPSRSQPVTPQVDDTTQLDIDTAIIVASAEMQTSNTPTAIAVSLAVIVVVTVIVLGLLYHYGFLGKWALLDSYVDRFRVRFMGNTPDRPTVETEPLRSTASRAS